MMNREDRLQLARESKANKKKLVYYQKLVRRRRRAGEIPTRKVAIQNHCRECMGFTADDMPSLMACVKACTAPECWLYPWRLGALDETRTASNETD